MSIRGLNEVVGKACISDSFRAGLFNGQRTEMLRQFADKLDGDEQLALLNIEAEVLADFAAAVEQLIAQRAAHRSAAPAEPVALSIGSWPSLMGHTALYQHG